MLKHEWCKLPQDTRVYLAGIYNLQKTEGNFIDNGILKSDGYAQSELDRVPVNQDGKPTVDLDPIMNAPVIDTTPIVEEVPAAPVPDVFAALGIPDPLAPAPVVETAPEVILENAVIDLVAQVDTTCEKCVEFASHTNPNKLRLHLMKSKKHAKGETGTPAN